MAVEFRNYYEVLGVAKDASQEAIRTAFRKLARKYHPDVAEDKVAGEEKFKELNEAYEVLSDPEKRKKYDTLGPDWKQGADFSQGAGAWPGGGGGFQDRGGFDPGTEGYDFNFGGSTGYSDFFEHFFSGRATSGFPGGRAGQGGGMKMRGGDVEADILVSLEEVMEGSERTLSLQRASRSGNVETSKVRVRIPKGVTEGQSIRCAGLGQPGTGGGANGDLFLHVHLEHHPWLRAEGNDLYCELLLAPWEAVLGTEIEVPALHHRIRLRVPENTVSGTVLRVPGKGLPTSANGPCGDFFCVVDIVTPEATTDEEKALWRQLSTASTFCPRT